MSISPQASDLGAGRGRPPVVKLLTVAAATGASTVLAAQGAGTRIVGLSLTLSTGDATGGLVSLKTGAGGTIIWQGFVIKGQIIPDNPGVGAKVFECGTNALLEINNGNAAAAYLNLRYIIEQVQ